MYTLDASIFIRDLDPYDPDHLVCRRLFEHFERNAVLVVVPFLLVAEVGGTVSRTRRDPMRARLAVDAIRALPYIRFVPIDDALATLAAEIAGDYYLRGADAVYVAVTRWLGTTLVSLDNEQRNRVASIVTARTPAEVLTELSSTP